MNEKRQRQRRRVLRTGRILFANGACILDCTIKNITEHGAMLQIDHAGSVPDEFQLYEPTKLLLHEARVVRRANHMVGVAITSTRDIAESLDPRLKRLKMIA